MVGAKREHDGFLAAFTATEIVRRIPFGGANLNPHELNPFRVVDPEVQRQIEAVKRFIASNALAVRSREAKEAALKSKKG